jgi:hypothetical protein
MSVRALACASIVDAATSRPDALQSLAALSASPEPCEEMVRLPYLLSLPSPRLTSIAKPGATPELSEDLGAG